MHVAVLDLLRSRRPHVEDLAFEAQPLARPAVIAVEHCLAVGDVGDAPHDLVAVLLGDRGVPPTATSGGSWSSGLDAHQLGVVVAERIGRLDVTETVSPTFLCLSAASTFGKIPECPPCR